MKKNKAKLNNDFYSSFYQPHKHASFETKLLCSNLQGAMQTYVNSKRVLEIGFGSGTLLKQILNNQPVSCCGLEE